MPVAPDQLLTLREQLRSPDDNVARQAARKLGKARLRAVDAVDDLFEAATAPWKFGCPQRFPDAIDALLKIAPSHPRLVPIIRDTIWCSNYGIQKTCVTALLKIGTFDAIETLYNLDQYWRASPKEGPFKRLVYKTLSKVEARGLDKLIPDSAAARERLVDWLEDRLQGPPCPNCGQQLRTRFAKQCFRCGHDWH